MRQYDVCRLRMPRRGLVLIIQNDVSDRLTTRVVAPLSDEPYETVIERLRFHVEVGGNRSLLMLDRLAAVQLLELGPVAGNLAHEQDRIKSALDLLFLGF